LLLDQGHTLQAAAQAVSVDYNSVAAWRNRYNGHGLVVLEDAPRSGRPIRIEGEQRAKITARACSTPPQGHPRWSLRLLADKAVELGYIETVSHDGVRSILKKTLSSRTWCIPGASARSTAASWPRWSRFYGSQILWLYSLPYDPQHALVCFDERPCFLIGNAVAPLNPQPGRCAREHYAYTNHGSCCLLACNKSRGAAKADFAAVLAASCGAFCA
jgi:transposase